MYDSVLYSMAMYVEEEQKGACVLRGYLMRWQSSRNVRFSVKACMVP